MRKEYVEKVEGGAYRVAGTRVSLDSVVYGFWNGESPETIAQSFPALTLEQVYGAGSVEFPVCLKESERLKIHSGAEPPRVLISKRAI